ncbi:MAG: hypothetical protein EXR51_03410 [Dehalococcoidia bacterium]|nr:hypothetical protein [Dehalococcoidia bacterium]
MAVIRTIRPTDLVALAAFDGRSFPNMALARGRLGGNHSFAVTVGTILEQWIISENRHTVVAMGGLAIHGLASAKHRKGRSVWEVDSLVVANGSDAENVALPLLEEVVRHAGQSGVRTLLLRLEQDNPVLMVARRSGFTPYQHETLLRGRGRLDSSDETPEPPGRRTRLKADDLPLFRLYCDIAPTPIRAVEGMTLNEWKDHQDTAAGRVREYVWSEADRCWGWLQVAAAGGHGELRVLCIPETEDRLVALIGFGLARLGKNGQVLVLVPDYQSVQARVLTDRFAFEAAGRYVTLTKQLSVRVGQLRTVPAGARLASGSSGL